jgi:hypothetical protein
MHCNSIAFYIANNFPIHPLFPLIDYHLKSCIDGLDSRITLSEEEVTVTLGHVCKVKS